MKHMWKSRSRRVGICSVALAVSYLFMPAAANATVDTGVNVLDWNICGDMCNSGATVTAGDATITAWHPAILMLEEVCKSQVSHFANLNSGFDSNYVFFPKRTAGCGSIGTAILTHQAISSSSSVTIPVDVSSGARDTVGCVRTHVGVDPDRVAVEACVTHLDNDSAGATQNKQLNGTSSWQGAAAWAQDQANGVALVFGGDFNLTRTSSKIAPLYSNILEYGSTQTGQYFHELDQASNQATAAAGKIDYIFYKHSYAKNYVAKPVVSTSQSDHKILYGEADLCSTSSCT